MSFRVTKTFSTDAGKYKLDVHDNAPRHETDQANRRMIEKVGE